MITVNIREDEEFIKLGQALKKASLVGSGVEAKMVIQDGLVELNGEVKNSMMETLFPIMEKQLRL